MRSGGIVDRTLWWVRIAASEARLQHGLLGPASAPHPSCGHDDCPSLARNCSSMHSLGVTALWRTSRLPSKIGHGNPGQQPRH